MNLPKSLPLAASCVLTLLAWSPALRAAPVAFDSPVTLAGEKDVKTTGILERAVNFGGGDVTVNGVRFYAGNVGAGQTNLEIGSTLLAASDGTSIYMGDSPTFSGSGDPFNTFPEAYKTLLSSAAYDNKTSGTLTLTIGGLKPGTTYLVQFFVNDSRDSHGGGRTETISSGSANSGPMLFSSTGAAGGVGQSVTATFTADGPAQVFVLAPVRPEVDDAQLNALQVRTLSATPAASPAKGKAPATPAPRRP